MAILCSNGTNIVQKAESVVRLRAEGRDYERSFIPEFEIPMKSPNEAVK